MSRISTNDAQLVSSLGIILHINVSQTSDLTHTHIFILFVFSKLYGAVICVNDGGKQPVCSEKNPSFYPGAKNPKLHLWVGHKISRADLTRTKLIKCSSFNCVIIWLHVKPCKEKCMASKKYVEFQCRCQSMLYCTLCNTVMHHLAMSAPTMAKQNAMHCQTLPVIPCHEIICPSPP